MPFIPHTQDDIDKMLQTLNVKSIDDLFDEIPKNLLIDKLDNIKEGETELEVTLLMEERALQNTNKGCFLGAGAYQHHIPAAVWQLAQRGEFMTAYTPYQAEASQGTLQTIYEYQSMMAYLMQLDISNASMYDGASCLAEATLMAVRLKHSKKTQILVPENLNPRYQKVLKTITQFHGLQLTDIPFKNGVIDFDTLQKLDTSNLAGLIISQPNFFGHLEEVDALTNWAHEKEAYVIGVVNPIAMSILKPPGKWGEKGADIACGEAQPLGIPLAAGGPYVGFMCCKEACVRQMPGRIVGKSTDEKGQVGYTLTLQAREQHIRRGKATSNICTNQGLMMTAATIYLSLLGSTGLQQIARACHCKAKYLKEQLEKVDGVEIVFHQPIFHEFVIRFKKSVKDILAKLLEHDIQGGYDLSEDYPDLGNALLVCVTETKSDKDLQNYESALKAALK